MTVGEKIKYFRTLHGFTQDQLIQATGLSISTLQKYESDERKPKPEQLLKISQALGISINVFMDLPPWKFSLHYSKTPLPGLWLMRLQTMSQ